MTTMNWAKLATFSDPKWPDGRPKRYRTERQAQAGATALERRYPFYETRTVGVGYGLWHVLYRKAEGQ